MATLKQYDIEGNVLGETIIDDALLQVPANPQLVKDYIVAIRHNQRQWSANTKRRREVEATGAKPHPQKGTGRARQGCVAATQFRGGGRAFGPRPKFDQHMRINQKEKRLAIAFLLAEQIKEKNSLILKIEEENITGKTKQIAMFLKKMQMENTRVFFVGDIEKKAAKHYVNLIRSCHNLPKVKFVYAANVNGYDLAVCKNMVFLDSSVEQMQKMLAKVSGK